MVHVTLLLTKTLPFCFGPKAGFASSCYAACSLAACSCSPYGAGQKPNGKSSSPARGMDTRTTRELASPEYWDKRYAKHSRGSESEHGTHEWFRTFEQLRPFLQKELPDPISAPRILHLGCGDSV